MSPSSDFIADFLKQNDPDRYFSTLVLKGETGVHIRALYAFGADAALVRARVSEPAIGEIRLQYWLDLLSGTEHGASDKNPLASGLMQVIDRYDLPTGPLRRLLAARRFDLYDDPMSDLDAFEGYAGETCSILYQLAAMVANGGNDAGAADAAGHMGVAHSLIWNLRHLSTTASRGQICLPWSIFTAHGVSEAQYLSGEASDGMIKGCADLRTIAAKHIHLVRTEIEKLDPKIRPVFSQIAILEHQLSQLEKFENLPFVSPPDLANWQKIAKIVWWNIRN